MECSIATRAQQRGGRVGVASQTPLCRLARVVKTRRSPSALKTSSRGWTKNSGSVDNRRYGDDRPRFLERRSPRNTHSNRAIRSADRSLEVSRPSSKVVIAQSSCSIRYASSGPFSVFQSSPDPEPGPDGCPSGWSPVGHFFLGLWESADAVVFAGAAAWGVARLRSPSALRSHLRLSVAARQSQLARHAIGNFAEAFRGC